MTSVQQRSLRDKMDKQTDRVIPIHQPYFAYRIYVLLHLGLVSSNRIAWNASHNCPLWEHNVPPQTRRGQWPLLWAIATRPCHLTSLVVCYLSFPHTIRTINFIYIFNYLNNYLPIFGFLSFTNIHCIATHTIKGIPFSPHFSIFYFSFGSKMNLVSSLFL